MMQRMFTSRRRAWTTLIALLILALSGPVSALAHAESFTDNEKIPIDIFVSVECANGGAGDFVELTGTLHVLFHVTLDASGGFHSKFHFQPQDIAGTGLYTGAKYQATGVTQGQFNGKVGLEETFVNNFRIIGQGPGNNLLIHENFHVTVNANGTVTAFVDNFRATCK